MKKGNFGMHELSDKLVVYTGIFGGYDRLREPTESFDGCDFVCFTDDPTLNSAVWKVIYVPAEKIGSASLNRRYKILPHRYLSQYRYSLYVDGNIRVVGNPRKLVNKYLVRHCIAIPPHQDRNCVYEEAKACIARGVVHAPDVEAQIAEYAEDGFPKNMGLWENGILLREHHNSAIIQLMEDLWDAYTKKSKRDQIALSYLRWKNGVQIVDIAEGPRVSSKYFRIGLHAADLDAGWVRKVSRYAVANRRRRLIYGAMAQLVDLGVSLRAILR